MLRQNDTADCEWKLKPLSVQKLNRNTLTSDAYDVVRGMLLYDARFEPGQKLSIELISRELGVSRSPIWSAIARLEVEGLVNVTPRQGVFLATFDADRLNNLFDVREALEGMAARLAATRMTDADISALKALMEQNGSTSLPDVDSKVGKSSFVLHTIILESTGNPLIIRQLQSIYDQIRAIYRGQEQQRVVMDVARSQREHGAIVDAIARRDEDASEALGRTHVRHSKEALVHHLFCRSITERAAVV